ncbi:MAG TPA: hypothetical protein VMV60_17370 [Thermoanaerobaculia bacterium]|nr:hypothetical protein [Thermoanaerobaculia bacterium]
MGSILCLTARAESEIRFEPPVSADQARRWEAAARTVWPEWEARFRAKAERPPLTVGLLDVASLPRDLGRSRGGRIELNASLPREAADATFRHELAHVFFESRCPGLANASPLLSEAFALHASGDAARRLASTAGLPTLASAREWLVLHAEDARPDERAASRALVRVLGPGGGGARWDAAFGGTLGACRDASFSASSAVAAFVDEVRGTGDAPAPSRTDFLLLDGLSGETLAEDGRPRARFPTGSILKPSLVAAVPALLEPRPARDDAAWRCPSPPRAGEPMAWEDALRRSCNGFFLDFAPPDGAAFAPWEEMLRRLGLAEPPRTMEGRIGLVGDYAVSPLDVVRLFSWLDRSAPHVVDALRGTPETGTLASAPSAAWFAARGIALKTGTVRDARSLPLHAWIVAVGPRTEAGAPSFVAALHATSRATSSLLPELRRRLEAALTSLETPAAVQILGLVPAGTIGVACDPGVPLATRSPEGEWSLGEPGASKPAGTLLAGAAYACPASRLLVLRIDPGGDARVRPYFGTLHVEAPPAAPPSSVPLREKSARARAGSWFVLRTSVLSYVTSSVLSESASSHAELQKALSLVVRNNRLAGRHGDRPPCDTTHCNLFGQDERVPAPVRARARAAVAAAASLEIAPPASGRSWLPFFLGGKGTWSEARSAAEIQSELALPAAPTRIAIRGDGSLDVEAGGAARVSCETLRNQLRLPSCPDRIAPSGEGFVFRGAGEGHGAGLDVTAANAAAAEGADFRALLDRAYPGLVLRPATSP